MCFETSLNTLKKLNPELPRPALADAPRSRYPYDHDPKALLLGAAALLCSAASAKPARTMKTHRPRPKGRRRPRPLRQDRRDLGFDSGLREVKALRFREEQPRLGRHAVSVSADRFVVLARNKVAVKDGKTTVDGFYARSTRLETSSTLPRERRARQSLAHVVSRRSQSRGGRERELLLKTVDFKSLSK